MELFLDTYEEHRVGSRVLNKAGDDVRKFTGQITDLMRINSDLHAPPLLVFTWGKKFSFTCLLARVSQRFVAFRVQP